MCFFSPAFCPTHADFSRQRRVVRFGTPFLPLRWFASPTVLRCTSRTYPLNVYHIGFVPPLVLSVFPVFKIRHGLPLFLHMVSSDLCSGSYAPEGSRSVFRWSRRPFRSLQFQRCVAHYNNIRREQTPQNCLLTLMAGTTSEPAFLVLSLPEFPWSPMPCIVVGRPFPCADLAPPLSFFFHPSRFPLFFFFAFFLGVGQSYLPRVAHARFSSLPPLFQGYFVLGGHQRLLFPVFFFFFFPPSPELFSLRSGFPLLREVFRAICLSAVSFPPTTFLTQRCPGAWSPL